MARLSPTPFNTPSVAGTTTQTNRSPARYPIWFAHFPASTVDRLLADREFVGADWLRFLNENNIPFAIRLREDLRVVSEDGCELTLFARLRDRRKTQIFRGRLWADHDRDGPLLNFAARRLGNEWLIVVSNFPAPAALAAYRKRWSIERLFADAKTRGLNIEDTRLTDPKKLDLLMALVALALVWAGRAAVDLLHPRAPTRKSHGCLSRSWFRTGFDHIRRRLRTDPAEAAAPGRRLPSKTLKRPSVV